MLRKISQPIHANKCTRNKCTFISDLVRDVLICISLLVILCNFFQNWNKNLLFLYLSVLMVYTSYMKVISKYFFIIKCIPYYAVILLFLTIVFLIGTYL